MSKIARQEARNDLRSPMDSSILLIVEGLCPLFTNAGKNGSTHPGKRAMFGLIKALRHDSSLMVACLNTGEIYYNGIIGGEIDFKMNKEENKLIWNENAGKPSVQDEVIVGSRLLDFQYIPDFTGDKFHKDDPFTLNFLGLKGRFYLNDGVFSTYEVYGSEKNGKRKPKKLYVIGGKEDKSPNFYANEIAVNIFLQGAETASLNIQGMGSPIIMNSSLKYVIKLSNLCRSAQPNTARSDFEKIYELVRFENNKVTRKKLSTQSDIHTRSEPPVICSSPIFYGVDEAVLPRPEMSSRTKSF